MSPEYGSTIAIFPIDGKTIGISQAHRSQRRARSLLSRPTPRLRVCGTASEHEPQYSEYLELDLGTVVPSIAGPKRPQDRVLVAHAKQGFREALRDFVSTEELAGWDESVDESFPASDVPSRERGDSREPHEYGEEVPADIGRPEQAGARHPGRSEHRSISTTVRVVIAAITSCTNTSNPA